MDAVQAVLRAPGDLKDVVGDAVVAGGERDADARGAQVVPGGLDEDASGVPGAGLGDRAVGIGFAGLLARGDEPQPGAQLHGARKALKVADLQDDDQRGERVDAAERAQPADDRPELRVARDPGEALVERFAAGEQARAGGEVVQVRQLGMTWSKCWAPSQR